MPTKTAQTVTEALNQQLADWNVLYIKLHNYHWYVKGPQFFTLHAKFQELYQEAALHIDEIAERILTIKGQPLATMKDYLAESNVSEANGTETAEQMVQTLVDDFDKVLNSLKNGMDIADQAGDETTSDMLLAIYSSLEKHSWMLRAFLGRK